MEQTVRNQISSHPQRIVLMALLVATILKALWAVNSAGTIDAVLFFNFARAIREHGLCQVYTMGPLFNHTPLTGSMAYVLYLASGGEVMAFALLLRLLSIVADVAVVVGMMRNRSLLGNPPWWALTLFALSPVSLMISGFHGNVDPIMVALMFFAALASVGGRPFLSGVLFALACNVKIAPVVFAPVFFFFWLPKGGAWRFAAASISLLVLGSLWPLCVCPADYLRNVLGYGSSWGTWGVTCLLRFTGWDAVQTVGFQNLSPIQTAISQALKFIIIGGIGLMGWRRRRQVGLELIVTIAMGWIWFFIFAPGVGVQYFVWPAPFLLLVAPRGFAILTAAGTAFVAVFYQTASKGVFPWVFINPIFPTLLWSLVGIACWLVFIGLFVVNLRRWWNGCSLRAPVMESGDFGTLGISRSS
jgi:hypothetical protein